MKSIRFILLALICTLLLAACERPAPAGEVPAPDENNSTEIVPRTDETNPDATTDETPTESTQPLDSTTPITTTETPVETTTETEAVVTDPTETDATAEEPANETPPLQDGVYTVRTGDTLGQIAFIYGISVEDLMAANNLTNPDVLDVGQQLTIPDPGFAETADNTPPADDTATEDPPADTASEEQIHIVQAGDNLYRIGLRYGFTVDELAEYNSLTNINNLEVGQEIRIPPSN